MPPYDELLRDVRRKEGGVVRKGRGATLWKIISKCRFFEVDNKSTFKREKEADNTLRSP